MDSTRIVYTRVYAPDPYREEDGQIVRVMVCGVDGPGTKTSSIDFAEATAPAAFKFFAQLDDQYMPFG